MREADRLLEILTARGEPEGVECLRLLVEAYDLYRAMALHAPEPGDCCARVAADLAAAKLEVAKAAVRVAALREDTAVLRAQLAEARARAERWEDTLRAAKRAWEVEP